ncbi:MAG: hypothetical protein LJE70_12450 [Chromatiaceae bacterium]|nr:hypothetical protein [Chromatiaceae bacterium]
MDSAWMHKKDEVFIRTKFREQHESEYTASREEMIENEDWRKGVGAQGGPFCYTDEERLMPFLFPVVRIR